MIVALLFIFILLQIADCLTTIYILKNGGREANPVLAWLFNKVGMIPSLIAMKLITIGVVAWAWNEWITLGVTLFYTGVVGWNSYQIWKTK